MVLITRVNTITQRTFLVTEQEEQEESRILGVRNWSSEYHDQLLGFLLWISITTIITMIIVILTKMIVILSNIMTRTIRC